MTCFSLKNYCRERHFLSGYKNIGMMGSRWEYKLLEELEELEVCNSGGRYIEFLGNFTKIGHFHLQIYFLAGVFVVVQLLSHV